MSKSVKNGNNNVSWVLREESACAEVGVRLGVFQEGLYEVDRIWRGLWYRIQKKGEDKSRYGKGRTISRTRKSYPKPGVFVSE